MELATRLESVVEEYHKQKTQIENALDSVSAATGLSRAELDPFYRYCHEYATTHGCSTANAINGHLNIIKMLRRGVLSMPTAGQTVSAKDLQAFFCQQYNQRR